jgi:hypothetical protein
MKVIFYLLLIFIIILFVIKYTDNIYEMFTDNQKHKELESCDSDNDCETTMLCIKDDSDKNGLCMVKCDIDSDCGRGLCGRYTAGINNNDSSKKICCPGSSTDTISGLLHDYCNNMPDGSVCYHNNMCRSDNCDTSGNVCGDPPESTGSDADAILLAAYLAECAYIKATGSGRCTNSNDSCGENKTKCDTNSSCVSGNCCENIRINPGLDGQQVCCADGSYYEPSVKICLPFSKCIGSDGKMMICENGKKCDPTQHKCI